MRRNNLSCLYNPGACATRRIMHCVSQSCACAYYNMVPCKIPKVECSSGLSLDSRVTDVQQMNVCSARLKGAKMQQLSNDETRYTFHSHLLRI